MDCSQCGKLIEKPVCDYCGLYHYIFFVTYSEEVKLRCLANLTTVMNDLSGKSFIEMYGHKIKSIEEIDRPEMDLSRNLDPLARAIMDQRNKYMKNGDNYGNS